MANKNIISFFGVDRQYANLREEILEASDRVYRTGRVLDGAYTREFERKIALRCDRAFALAVNSCTQGLIFAMTAALPPEGKVLIPALSFAATANSAILADQVPVFCDTDRNALIDLESMDMALDAVGIRGIMYANLFGHIVDWDRFRIQTEFFNQDILIIEDAAQSFGASYKTVPSGALGDISVLSFDPTKNLNNYGSGGMILCDNQDLYHSLLELRDNGKNSGHQFPGTNSKMSESDCAQLLVKLDHFDRWQDRRQEIADYYHGELNQYVDCVMPGEDVVSAWSKFVIRVSERDGLAHHLSISGIETKMHYDKPLFDLPVGYGYVDDYNLYREATAFSKECLSLPIYPELTDSEVEHVVNSVQEFFL